MIGKPRHPDARAALTAVLSAVLSATLLGCGTDEEGGGELTTARGEAHRLDPAFAYTSDRLHPVEANETMSMVYTPLLAYRREEGLAGAELIPGLAQDLPEISEDGRTYRLTLRDGLEYSNGRAVRASDFEHSIKRVLTAGSPAASFFERIEGVDEYLGADDPQRSVRGIRTDDETGEIVIELTEPDASFSNALAMWFAAPVPRNTSFRDRTAHPPPGVGPYEVTESVPGRRFVLERSETFPRLDLPDMPTGNFDRITTEIVDDLERRTEDVLAGELDYTPGPPAEDLRARLLAEGDERYRAQPGPGTFFFFFDVRTPPFDDPRVREAVNHAIDRPALARLFDGQLEPGCSFLPPGTPGYDEALDTTQCPYGDPSGPPDVERARRLVEVAGATGARVTVWESDEAGLDEAGDAYAETLEAIGLDVGRAIAADRGAGLPPTDRPSGTALTGAAGWFADFPHPLNVYSPLDAEDVATSLSDRRIEREIGRLNLEPDLDSVAEEWAELDRYLISPPQSYLAPFGHPRLTRLVSERIDLERARTHPVYLNDHLRFALAEGQ